MRLQLLSNIEFHIYLFSNGDSAREQIGCSDMRYSAKSSTA